MAAGSACGSPRAGSPACSSTEPRARSRSATPSTAASDCASITDELRMAGVGRGGLGCGRRLEVHPHHFPNVAVGILETAAIHKAVVLPGTRIDAAARGLRLADHVID